MTAPEFEARVNAWASSRSDIEALIQIGSRVQSGAVVDAWSDWDYHLITRKSANYRELGWLNEIAPVWCAHAERTSSGVIKVGAVFAGGLEADFVLLEAWQMRVLYWAMARPKMQAIYPARLIRGIYDTKRVVGLGYRVVADRQGWAARLVSLQEAWPQNGIISPAEFGQVTTAFWRHAVWILKKTGRGEMRAAVRCYVRELYDQIYILLAEEARLSGRGAGHQIRFGDYPARKAEQWLDERRLAQTVGGARADQRDLARALGDTLTLFREASEAVAAQRGFPIADHSAVEKWLREELAKLDAGTAG
jgi:hypothetical protein